MLRKCFKTLNVLFAALLITGSALAQPAQPTDHPEDRTALRAILTKGVEALNTRNFDAITSSLHPNFTIISVDNKKFVGVDAFKTYYQGLFDGPQSMLKKVDTNLVVDEATRFLDDHTGVVYGTSKDTYHFKDGDVRIMETRWSALTRKESDGWKLVNVHFSTDVFDNPILEATKAYARKIAIISGLGGLGIGILLMLLMRRRYRA